MGRTQGKKSKGRRWLVLLGLAGLGAAVASQRKRNLSPVADVEPVETPAPPAHLDELDVREETPAPPAHLDELDVREETPAPPAHLDELDVREETPAPPAHLDELDVREETPAPGNTTDPLVDPIATAESEQDDSGSFFEQVMAETEPPARPRRTRRTSRKASEGEQPAE